MFSRRSKTSPSRDGPSPGANRGPPRGPPLSRGSPDRRVLLGRAYDGYQRPPLFHEGALKSSKSFVYIRVRRTDVGRDELRRTLKEEVYHGADSSHKRAVYDGAAESQ